MISVQHLQPQKPPPEAVVAQQLPAGVVARKPPPEKVVALQVLLASLGNASEIHNFTVQSLLLSGSTF